MSGTERGEGVGCTVLVHSAQELHTGQYDILNNLLNEGKFNKKDRDRRFINFIYYIYQRKRAVLFQLKILHKKWKNIIKYHKNSM